MQEELYQRYIERICIVTEDGLLAESTAMMEAAREVIPMLRETLGSGNAVRDELAEYKNRARKEGVIK